MRWGALPSLAAPSAASCPALLALRAPPVPGTRVGAGLPAPYTFPGVAPKVVPVSNGESIFTASANTAQEPKVNYY